MEATGGQVYIFVAGCGHTGTTLMASILGSHSAIYTIPRETSVFLRSHDKKQIEDLFQSSRDVNMPSKPIICEKTPKHVHYITKIIEYFPEAKIVLMIRDGRDVVTSLKTRTGLVEPSIRRWVDDTSATLQCRALPNVKIVKYEDLVVDPTKIISDLCGFIGVSFQSEMLRFYENTHNWHGEKEVRPTEPAGIGEPDHRARRNWQVHQKLFDGRGRWRDLIELDELIQFNRAGASLMEELGYYSPVVGDLDSPFPTIPIETCSENKLESYKSWQAQIRGREAEAIQLEGEYDTLLDEEHHRIYGRPWCVGRSYFEFLIQQAVLPTDKFLDFGCGAGRLGISMIRYLRPGCYFGIDSHRPSLEAFADYEIPLHGMAYKAPRLLLDETANLGHFGARFDVIVDLWVTQHLELNRVRAIYQSFADFLQPNGRVFLANPPKLPKEQLSALGFEICASQVRSVRSLQSSKKPSSKTDHWHILRRNSPSTEETALNQ